MNIARGLPDVFQSSIIPTILTNLSSGSIQLIGWSNPQHTQFQAANIVTSYGMLQGQAGNEQMVRLALSKSDTYLPQDLETPVIIYHGTQDKLILENSILELVRQLKERNCSGVKFVSIPDGDHNSIMAHPANLGKVMSSLVGDADKWAAEIFKSLGRQSRSMQAVTRIKSPPTSPDQGRKTTSHPKSRSMPGRAH
jgi:pimeloyl-ACP methyl ester carboxylesterase